ncbi:MAG: 50S ribosome-binding GTPase [Bacteriovoracaceae bacterium]|nr:50S ribosome-binding GTPase [Bacteriovoracaceae bacterium]
MKRSMVISLIGRPNVGKSSLFNRLMRKANRAITFDKPGVTRDRHYGIAKFDELADEKTAEAIMVDTGGFYPEGVDETGKNDEEVNYNKFFNIMTNHAKLAIEESDLVLFVVDVREGVIPFDETIARYIRQSKKPFWLLVNKYDTDKQYGEEAEFYSLGINPDHMHVVSAAHGRGMDGLKSSLHEEILHFENSKDATNPDLQKGVTPREDVVSKIAIVGAPNAGKSTLLNKLVGSERALVSDVAGTTVDPIQGFFDLYFGKDAEELEFDKTSTGDGHQLLVEQYEQFRNNNPDFFKEVNANYDHVVEADEVFEEFVDVESAKQDVAAGERVFNAVFNPEEEVETEPVIEKEPAVADEDNGSYWRSIHIVDTAGIRKKHAVDGFIEEQSVYRALRSITEAEVVVFMIDATKGVSHQDRRLLDIAEEKGKSVIICMNKLDLMKEKLVDDRAKREWIEDIRDTIPWLNHCDVIPISAKYNKRIKLLQSAIKKTILVRRKKVPTGALNRHLYHLIDRHPVALKGGGGSKRLKIKYASMIKANPPTFILFSNRSQGIPDSYKRYLKNGLRSEFGFENTPVHLIFRTSMDLEKRMKKVEKKSEPKSAKKFEKK